MSWNGPLLISSATRLQGIFFWPCDLPDRGLLFPADGIPDAVAVREIESVSAGRHPFATGAGRGDRHVARFAWLYPATYLPRIMSKRLRERDPAPPWQWPFILSLPGCEAQSRWPQRWRCRSRFRPAIPSLSRPDPVRFIRVISSRWWDWASACRRCAMLGIARAGRDEHIAEHDRKSRRAARTLAAALASLDAMTDDRELSDEVVKLLRARHEIRANQLPDSLDPERMMSRGGNGVDAELISAERKFIHVLLARRQDHDEIRRRIETRPRLEKPALPIANIARCPL